MCGGGLGGGCEEVDSRGEAGDGPALCRAGQRAAASDGLPVGPRGGIVVDERCRTEDPAVLAIGECAQAADGRVYGLVAPGYRMAETAARELAGRPGPGFTGADTSTELKLLGVDVASFGDPHGTAEGALDVLYSDGRRGVYRKLVIGAGVDRLPAIWAGLVDAGFESGHAYGKALRTVKSCVGETWCRYGVQDSVGLAIELELRYRGLRSPHKLKSAVSGCARECAEARSKDFGIIATSAGWNLYVGGNGGTTPRHADLLAADLDRETLIRTIDRYLMFYIRTADRLERTSVWLERLDGGLDHLRAVVLDDALGIAAELDALMDRHIDSYQDEWAATLADPDRLRRFASFVNAPGTPDPAVTFVPERGQIRPARPDEDGHVLPAPAPVLVAGPRLEVLAK